MLPNVKWTGEEADVLENVPDNVSDHVPEKISADAAAILAAIRRDPEITKNELAAVIGKTPKTVGRKLAELKEKCYIERIGSDRKGYWKILN